MWHQVVIEIERTQHFIGGIAADIVDFPYATDSAIITKCWNILYKAPIAKGAFANLTDDNSDWGSFNACEVWIG